MQQDIYENTIYEYLNVVGENKKKRIDLFGILLR